MPTYTRYKFEDIEKILEFSSWKDKRKIDVLLEIDAIMYMNLGIDSTKKEKEDVKKMSRVIYRLIKTIDKVQGDLLLKHFD